MAATRPVPPPVPEGTFASQLVCRLPIVIRLALSSRLGIALPARRHPARRAPEGDRRDLAGRGSEAKGTIRSGAAEAYENELAARAPSRAPTAICTETRKSECGGIGGERKRLEGACLTNRQTEKTIASDSPKRRGENVMACRGGTAAIVRVLPRAARRQVRIAPLTRP